MRKCVKFAIIQMAPTHNFSHDLARAKRFLARAKGKADFAVFPEYFLGWENHSAEILKTFKFLAKTYGLAIVVGSFIETVKNKQYNTCVLIDNRGRLVGKYRKRHLYAPWEGQLKAGKIVKPYYTVNGVKIAIAICLDIYFAAEIADHRSADIIIIPSMTEASEIDDHVAIVKTRAIENVIPVILANAAGRTRLPVGDKRWGGKSCAFDAEGRLISKMDRSPGCLVMKIDLWKKFRIRRRLYDIFHLK